MTGKISEMPAAAALNGTESVPLVQGGSNVRATVADAAAYFRKGLAGVNNQAGAAYTLIASDAGKDIRFTGAVAATLTIPDDTVAFDIGTIVFFSQSGTGTVTAQAAAGVTINMISGDTGATSAQHDMRGLEKTAANTWRLV